MIYDNTDPELLKFLQDPLNNIDKLSISSSKIKWHTRLLYKLPRLHFLISPIQTQWLVSEKLQHGLNKAKNSLNQITFEDDIVLNEKNTHRYTDALKEYFAIDISLIELEINSSQEREMINAFVNSNLWSKIEYTCNRISENLGLQASHNLSILRNQELWLSYYMSEIYFLMAHGLMSAKLNKGIMSISTTPKSQTKTKGYWLSEIFEANSKLSDMRVLLDVALLFKKRGNLPPALREHIIDYTLDKCLSIHAKYLSPEILKHPKYEYLREIVYFSVHLEMHAVLGERIVSRAELKVFVTPAAISLIDSALSGRTPSLNSATSFVEVQEKNYSRGQLSFKYGLKKLVGFLLGGKQVAGAGRDFNHALGMGFELDYITNYVKEINDPRLKVYGGLNPGNNAKIKGYDIDLVLHNQEDDIYYFIQVKYRLADLPTYLSERCRLFSDSEFRKGFTKQLLTLKENFSDESIRKKFNQHGIPGALEHNSYFVLLHNIPFLNFYELDGVFFYEWNLLRNILRGGRMQFRKDNSFTEAQIILKPRLHKPEEIVEAYFNHPESGDQLTTHYEIYHRANTQFSYGDLNVKCKMLL